MPVAQRAERCSMNRRSLGSNPSLVSEARLRDGRRVVNCDKLLSGSEHDQRREKVRQEGGSEDPDAPPWGFPDIIQQRLWSSRPNFVFRLIKIIQNGLSRQIPFIGNNHIQQQMLPAQRSARSDPGLLRLQTPAHGEGGVWHVCSNISN